MAITNRCSVLYTPCCCSIGEQLEGQQGACQTTNKRKSYKTSRRIEYLARPRKPGGKYLRHPVQRYPTNTTICRPYEEPYAPKRLQHLAEPHVRKLLAAQEEYRRFIARSRQDQLEKRIKKSIFTLYSRLANVQLPDLTVLHGMTPDEWQKHRDWLTRNAQPKKPPSPVQPKRDRKPLSALLNRIENLSVPRSARTKFTRSAKPAPVVSAAALKATATDHVLKLAEPIARRRRAKGRIEDDGAGKLPESVLKAEASSRIVDLAVAKRYANVNNEYRDNPFSVERNALKAKASDRILELSKPKKVKK